MRRTGFIITVCCLALAHATGAQPDPAPAVAPATAEPSEPPDLPGITIDQEAGHVDVAAVVANRDAEWLELLACTEGTRAYESILTVRARPRDIHLALMLLGLEPGQPLRFEHQGDDGFEVHPPTGPRVAISLIYETDGRLQQVPANRWVVHQETRQVLDGDTWLFTGSKIKPLNGEPVYMADVNGSAISLVNFGDDLLARDTDLTRDTDNKALTCRTTVIPAVGTAVTIRLTPADESGANEPAMGIRGQGPGIRDQGEGRR